MAEVHAEAADPEAALAAAQEEAADHVAALAAALTENHMEDHTVDTITDHICTTDRFSAEDITAAVAV